MNFQEKNQEVIPPLQQSPSQIKLHYQNSHGVILDQNIASGKSSNESLSPGASD